VAGFIGYITDKTVGAVFATFQPINPLFLVFGIAYAIISFLWGIRKAYYEGFFFSLGILLVGVILNDTLTFISGPISIAVILIIRILE
jgi:chromate transport protein ChrA